MAHTYTIVYIVRVINKTSFMFIFCKQRSLNRCLCAIKNCIEVKGVSFYTEPNKEKKIITQVNG